VLLGGAAETPLLKGKPATLPYPHNVAAGHGFNEETKGVPSESQIANYVSPTASFRLGW
jgi:hypothetical protein